MKNHRIAIDLYDIRSIYFGVGEFSYRLGSALAKKAEELKTNDNIELFFFVPQGYKGMFGDHVNYVSVSSIQRLLSLYRFRKFDIFHSTQNHGRIKTPVFARKIIQTIHDVNFMYDKPKHKQQKYYRKLGTRIRKADTLTFISHFAQNDVLKYYKIDKPAFVIYNGVTDLNADAEKGVFAEKDYLFHISRLYPSKNVHLLVEMMRYLPAEKLVIAGNFNSKNGKKIKQRIEELQLDNIIVAGDVDTETKAVMYRNCKAFLFPSLCEGFGLPPLEAMKFGKPVFLSNLTSLPEVGGEYAYYWEKLQPESMAEIVNTRLREFKQNPKTEEIKQWASQFTWERCGNKFIETYLKLITD